MAISIIKTDIPTAMSGTITKTSGIGTNPRLSTTRVGKVVMAQLSVNIPSGETVAAGADCFLGELKTTSLIPVREASFVGFYGARAIIGIIGTDGIVRVRNSSNLDITGSGADTNVNGVYVTK